MALVLQIQATPNAPRNEIVGWAQDRLRVKVKAPAVEGKANAELLRFLAKECGVRPNAVALVRGETARIKVVRIEGLDHLPEALHGGNRRGSPSNQSENSNRTENHSN